MAMVGRYAIPKDCPFGHTDSFFGLADKKKGSEVRQDLG